MFGTWSFSTEDLLRAAEQQRRRMVAESARQIVAQCNAHMTHQVNSYLRHGVETTIHAATARACREYGQTMAATIEKHLRNLGAKDVRVTCP